MEMCPPRFAIFISQSVAVLYVGAVSDRLMFINYCFAIFRLILRKFATVFTNKTFFKL